MSNFQLFTRAFHTWSRHVILLYRGNPPKDLLCFKLTLCKFMQVFFGCVVAKRQEQAVLPAQYLDQLYLGTISSRLNTSPSTSSATNNVQGFVWTFKICFTAKRKRKSKGVPPKQSPFQSYILNIYSCSYLVCKLKKILTPCTQLRCWNEHTPCNNGPNHRIMCVKCQPSFTLQRVKYHLVGFSFFHAMISHLPYFGPTLVG